MKKIKIAYFVGTMNCGGTETMLMNLFESLDKDKYDISFIENVSEKCWYDDEITNFGGKIIKIQNFSFKNIIKYINQLIEVFKKEKFDVVHSHVFLHSGLVMYAAKKAKIKIRISHSHSAMRKSDNNWLKLFILRKLILKNSNKLIACSTEAGLCLFGEKFLESGIVLPNPIQLRLINSIDSLSLNDLKKEYNIKSNELVIGHVGRLIEIKNHKFMLELAKILKSKNIDFKLFFIGDGPQKNDILNNIKSFKLTDNVILTGTLKNDMVYKFMKIFDIFLLPSFYEGLPVTLIEAQASGLYSIVSKNISRESDLDLGLVKFEDIADKEKWLDDITNFKKIYISQDNINSVIKQKKYDAEESKKEYEKLYNFL